MPTSTARLSVNIVSWNSMAFLPKLFDSLDEQLIPFRTIIVDNASTDGSVNWLTKEKSHITILRNMRNQGFSRAYNQTIQMALAGWADANLSECYIVVCNPDIELDSNCLKILFDFMETHPEVDACMPKLFRAYLRATETEQIKTERSKTLDATGLVITKSRRAYDRGAGESDVGQYDNAYKIFGVGGALSCYRASSLISAMDGQEFYDEDFFAYKEDVDMAWRFKRLGLKSAFVPNAIAWHHRTAPSSSSNNWIKALIYRHNKPKHINYFSTRNHIWFLVKHLSVSDLFFHGLWIFPYELCKLITAFFSRGSIKGYWHALTGLSKMLKKRKKYKQKERLDAHAIRGELV